jgi:hypothetical protein
MQQWCAGAAGVGACLPSRTSVPPARLALSPPPLPLSFTRRARSIARQVIFDPSCKVHASAGAQISPTDLQV